MEKQNNTQKIYVDKDLLSEITSAYTASNRYIPLTVKVGDVSAEMIMFRDATDGEFHVKRYPVSQAQWDAIMGGNPANVEKSNSVLTIKIGNVSCIEMVMVNGLSSGDYYIGRYPVTQSQWCAVMGNNPSKFLDKNSPVESITYPDVQRFIKKINELTGAKFRLPSESEWNYAAIGGNYSKGFKYSGSNNIDDVAWYKNNSDQRTHPVGCKQANELGIYDMSGNVSEWCKDIYSEGGTAYVIKGGNWNNNNDFCTIDHRSCCGPSFCYDYLGLRLALSV